jgi:hypothetical protein
MKETFRLRLKQPVATQRLLFRAAAGAVDHPLLVLRRHSACPWLNRGKLRGGS